MSDPLVLLESHSADREIESFVFSGLHGVVIARSPADVPDAIAELQEANSRGLHAAGFLSYEAAGGLDTVLTTQQLDQIPLLWFGLFRDRSGIEPGQLGVDCASEELLWEPSIDRSKYYHAVTTIKEYIAAGDTYQVNFTHRLRAQFQGDDRALYRDLCSAQQGSYSGYLNLGRFRILSGSPELFFALERGVLTCRPMKGTRRRGRWKTEDEELARSLQESEKERAENLMIVDLMRNDMGRVSVPGTVEVPSLWDAERYETVWQLTSTVSSRLRPEVALGDLFAALFPCGSVTGAPKVRTMEIIAELEDSPRGVYTGCLGYLSPGMEARFNVAIRTIIVDADQGTAIYGVGSGITWDSDAAGEYEECAVKASVLRFQPAELL